MHTIAKKNMPVGSFLKDFVKSQLFYCSLFGRLRIVGKFPIYLLQVGKSDSFSFSCFSLVRTFKVKCTPRQHRRVSQPHNLNFMSFLPHLLSIVFRLTVSP